MQCHTIKERKERRRPMTMLSEDDLGLDFELCLDDAVTTGLASFCQQRFKPRFKLSWQNRFLPVFTKHGTKAAALRLC